MAFFVGTNENDTLIGGIQNDIFLGLQGDDSLIGNAGNDVFFGGDDNDTLIGGIGNDVLLGEVGNDHLIGGEGEDTLFGSEGNNTLTGGAGVDLFAIGFNLGNSTNRITDFEVGVDKIAIPAFLDLTTLRFINIPNRQTSTPSGIIRIQINSEDLPPVVLAEFEYEGEVPNLTNPEDFITVTDSITSILEFSSPVLAVTEGTPVLQVTVNRVGSSQGTAGATVVLSDGTATASGDYDNTPISVTFADGETSQTVSIPIVDDSVTENLENFNLALSNPTGNATIGAQSTMTVFVIDNDVSLEFSSGSFNINENGTPIVEVTVNRSGRLDLDVGATVTLSNGTATAPEDYNNTSIAVNFTSGEISKTVQIPIVNDNLVEGLETVNLALENATGGATIGTQNTATLTILDNDVSLQFSSPIFSVVENGIPIVPVTVIRTGNPDQEVNATLTLTDGTATAPQDYNNTPINLTFIAGETQKVINVPIVQDILVEGTETINLILSTPNEAGLVDGGNSAILEIEDDDIATPTPTPTPTPVPLSPGTLQFGDANFLVNENGTSIAAVTVTRSNGSSGVVSATVGLGNGTAIAGQDYNNTPIVVTFAEGETVQTLNIPIINDSLVEVAETLNLALVNPTGGATIGEQNTATLTISRSDMPATLDFEGVGNINAVGNFYAAQGITFSDNALGIISSNALDRLGRSDEFGGNFGTPPSGITALTYGEADEIIMNVNGGFDSQLSFFYASPFRDHTVTIYAGLNATGTILASLPLGRTLEGRLPDAYSTFNEATLPFSGIARSVSFGDVANKLVLDNISLG